MQLYKLIIIDEYIYIIFYIYKGNCQDSKHEAHDEKCLLTERFEFCTEFILNCVSER